MQWTRHGNNYQWIRPDGFPIAIWVSHNISPPKTYSLCVYAGGTLIKQERCADPDTAKTKAREWLQELAKQIHTLLDICEMS